MIVGFFKNLPILTHKGISVDFTLSPKARGLTKQVHDGSATIMKTIIGDAHIYTF